MSDGAYLVVGLGNPGPTYAATRHNVGHLVVDVLAARVGGRFKGHRRGRSDVLETRLGNPPGVRTILAKPRTFMNTSGGPVAALLDYYDISPERLVVVHDELDIPFHTVRLKRGGGDNGHNGLRSVTSALGTRDYLRVRFGIGRPPGRQDPADFVLKPFSSTERKDLDVEVERAADAVEALVIDGLAYAQNTYHA